MRAENSSTASQTKIVSGEEEVSRLRSAFLSRASRHPEGYSYGANDKVSTIRSASGAFFDQASKLRAESSGFRLRHLTDIQAENIDAVKKLVEAGFEVRHIEGSKVRFSVSQMEYIETIHAREPGAAADQVLWSDDPQLVAQATRIFDTLWEQAVPARWRLTELQEGQVSSATILMREPEQIRRKLTDMASNAKKQIQLLLPTAAAFHRAEKIGVIDTIEAASMRGLKVTVVSPTDAHITRRVKALIGDEQEARGQVELIPIPEATSQGTVTVMTVDQLESMVVEQKVADAKDFEKAVGLAIYSTSQPIVRANVRFVERLTELIAVTTREEALLQKEVLHRRQAELLQDILTHDIRNFNQIVMTSAEALRDSVTGTNATLVDNILRATEGSSTLVQRAKDLSAILAGAVPLTPVDLEESIRRSLSIVTKGHPDKSLVLASPLASKSRVLADSLLDEVFTNLISNSVKYTDAPDVPLEIKIDEVIGPSAQNRKGSTQYIRVALIDQGRGIPDSMKERVFKRYQNTKSGSGLGLSIVHALVVERYKGRIVVADRVAGHYTRGTRIEVWLQKG